MLDLVETTTCLDIFVFDFDRLFPEVDANGSLGSVGEFSHAEAEGQASLSDVRVAQNDDFKDSPLFLSGGCFFHDGAVHGRHRSFLLRQHAIGEGSTEGHIAVSLEPKLTLRNP